LAITTLLDQQADENLQKILKNRKEKTAVNACLFVQVLCTHLRDCQVDMQNLKFQTDNGSEFIGCCRQDRTRDGFEKTVEAFGSRHKRIPVRAWSYNSDVETVHRTIEDEFYDLENFEGIRDFHQRAAGYQDDPRGRVQVRAAREPNVSYFAAFMASGRVNVPS
jgi:hypothetical protein